MTVCLTHGGAAPQVRAAAALRLAMLAVPAVQALCKLVGAPDYPFVVVEYPYNPTGGWSVDECNAMAAQVVDRVRLRLTA